MTPTFESELGGGRHRAKYAMRRLPHPGWWSAWKAGAADCYLINVRAGTCGCRAGRHARPCKHLAEARRLEEFVTATPKADPKPLWPQPVPILGLTGEYQSGKTWFGISMCPDPKRLRVYDLEMSAASYKSLGFDHVDVPQVMTRKYPQGYKPVDLWNWWLDDVQAIEPGRFDAILVDPITDLERGLTDWVSANPAFFGHTAGQYASMSGIMWGDLKDYWKLILTGRVATKCQTFAFTAHLGDEVKSKQFTGKRTPKGKDTLIELATLYLWLDRPKDAGGGRKQVPLADVLKSRLSHLSMGPDGPVAREALPPRLPVATPRAVRDYLLNPPDYDNLKPEERSPERVLTADERLRMELAKAEAERDTAAMRTGGAVPVRPAATPTAAAAPAPNGRPDSPPAETFEANFLAGIRAANIPDDLAKVGGGIKAAFEKGWIGPPHKERLSAAWLARQGEIRPAPSAGAEAVFDRAGAVGDVLALADELRIKDFAANLNRAYGKTDVQSLADEELADLRRRLTAKKAPKA